MNNLQSRKPKRIYKFKYKNRTMLLEQSNSLVFKLGFTETLKSRLTLSLKAIISLAVGVIAGFMVGKWGYGQITPSEGDYMPSATLFKEIEDFHNDVLDGLSIIGCSLMGIIVWGIVSYLTAFILLLPTYGSKTNEFLWMGTEEEKNEETYPISFHSNIQPYLHLLNPEVLYNYIEGKATLKKQHNEAHNLFTYSTQLKDGFLKDEVTIKREKIIDEMDILQKNIVEMLNQESDRLKNINSNESKIIEEKKYKKLEDEVLKTLSA